MQIYFFYLPLDTYANAEKLIKKLNIAFVIFIHNERWWNFAACTAPA